MPDVRSHTPRGGLLRHRDFRHLWLADAASQVGTRTSMLALPLLAVTVLHATTIEVSLLRVAQTLAYLLLGLQIGAWCDRVRGRPVVVLADLGRAAAFGWIPVAAALGVLTVWQVYLVVAVAGVLTVFFDVARQSYLPRLVAPTDLVEGNTKLAANASVAAVAGPGVAGGLVQWAGAPIAIGLNALTYLWSALWLRAIHTTEPPPAVPERRHLAREIGQGLRVVFTDPILRAFGLHGATMSLFQAANTAISVVFLVRVVGLGAGVIGVLSSAALIGAVASAAVTGALTRALGSARLLLLAGLIGGAGFLLQPLTAPGWRLVWTVASGFLAGAAITVLNIVEVSYQQAACPPALRGRVNATVRFLVWGAIPVGSVLGGVVGTAIGLRPTLWLAGAGALLAAAWLVCSPLRTMRDLPVPRTAAG